MKTREFIAYILIGIILFAWVYYTTPEPQPVKKDKIENKDTVQKIQAPVQSTKQIITTEKKEAIGPITKSTKETIANIENKFLRIEFTSQGARVKKVFLKNYTNWYYNSKDKNAKYYTKEVQLINNKDGGDFNIKFYDKSDNLINTAFYNFQLQNIEKLNDKTVITFKLNFPNNAAIIKRYIVYNEKYDIKTEIDFVNFNQIANIEKGYIVGWNSGIRMVEEYSHDEGRYTNAGIYQGGEHITYNIDHSHPYLQHSIHGKLDWANIRNKYFTIIFNPLKPVQDDEFKIKGWHKVKGNGEYKIYSFDYVTTFKGENNYFTDKFSLYFGPIDYDILKAYGKNYEQVVDFGNLFGMKFLIRPISEYLFLPLLKLLHIVIPNYGFVIIIFALIVKLLLFPITKITLLSQKKMSLLQPEIDHIRKTIEDPTKQQKEIMNLYSKYGINPAGGCLPLLLQMPILVALWSLFNVAIDLRNQPFALWITNLSIPDVIYTLPFKIPLFGVDQISALALLLGISMFLQQKGQIVDPSQKAMIYMMPIMMTMLFMSFPAGLNLYYLVFNIFSIAEQKLYFKYKGDIKLEVVKNKKKGWMQRMMEEAEKKQKMTEEMRKARKKLK